jgi:hypothetical protein
MVSRCRLSFKYFLMKEMLSPIRGYGSGNSSAGKAEALAVPETSTWAMMLVGFAGLGYAGYRTRARAKLRPGRV